MDLQEIFEVHDTLNPLLWGSDNKLLPDVKSKLLNIAQQFIKSTELPIKMLDLIIVGSNASYNYTSDSDIDLHIITNFDTLDASQEIITILANQLKSSFNSKYNITLHGIPVGIYIEDVQTNAVSNGIYSVLNDKWIKFPKKLDNIPQADISDAYKSWADKIGYLLRNGNSEAIGQTIDTLYMIRKNSIAGYGEYGKGNQLFKQLRSAGLFDKLKNAYYDAKSKELSLEHLSSSDDDLEEASKQQLISKSQSSPEGSKRYKNRVKSKIVASSNQFNSIDMNKLFKDNIFTVDLDVKGQSDTYTVKVSYGGFLDIVHDQLRNYTGEVDLKIITRALVTGFNRNDVYIHCTCPDFKYRFDYFATKNDFTSGEKQNTPSDTRNPKDDMGSACKHVLLVISNTSWIMKCANVIYNYIKYMQRTKKDLYQDIIYPALYDKKYEEPTEENPNDLNKN